MRSISLVRVAGLLFGSGFCALIYQTVWFREFRLIFGASTAANSAVLGIFMGGLGIGSWFLGRRAERQLMPLRYYALLEAGIAISAALSPFILILVRGLYLSTGGMETLGLVIGTAVRLILATVVIGLPAFLMGGTLPAAVKSVANEADAGRAGLACLYGINTFGAVCGTLLSTFFLIEWQGDQNTLWMTCCLNAIIALFAWQVAGRLPEREAVLAEEPALVPELDLEVEGQPAAPARFVFVASGLAGFVFFLMEIVWYRMLAPVLGGSTFTFGLILAIALLGIALGGLLYALTHGGRQAGVAAFALTCALESLLIAVPFALGDRIAQFTWLVHPLGALGFNGQILSWVITCLIVVFPGALIAGYQFPMLISLLGRGGEGIAVQTGRAYAFNTAGAIAGALAGGFGLLPLVTAPGLWRGMVWILAALVVAAIIILFASGSKVRWAGWSALVIGIFAALLMTSTGPTAFWRHSPIGAGRLKLTQPEINTVVNQRNFYNNVLFWQAEGRESSVGLLASSSFSFVVNGKSDGNARTDAGTQVMVGILAAALHPGVKDALVIGLGTGSTAGWLGQLPDIERVDVAEIEPAIQNVARLCAPVNANVLSNPKVHVRYDDAREVLLTTKRKYDLIVSEPSNPYRAGIASLFTKEYYQAAEHALKPGGYFAQWIQAYEVDSQTVRTCLATLGSVFGFVEVWETQKGDLLCIASREPRVIDLGVLRGRLATEPFKQLLTAVWGVEGVEGLLSHFVAGDAVVRRIVEAGDPVNTDDRNLLEFGFARMVGRSRQFEAGELADYAKKIKAGVPVILNGEVDWALVEAFKPYSLTVVGLAPTPGRGESAEYSKAAAIQALFLGRQYEPIIQRWEQQAWSPKGTFDLLLLCEALAMKGDSRLANFLPRLSKLLPVESIAVEAMSLAATGKDLEASLKMSEFFVECRTYGLVWTVTFEHALELARSVGRRDLSGESAKVLHEALSEPMAVYLGNLSRLSARIELARSIPGENGRRSLLADIKSLEPWIPWTGDFLKERAQVYSIADDRLKEKAKEDLLNFLSNEAGPFDLGLKK